MSYYNQRLKDPPVGQMFLVNNETATTLVQDVWTKVAGNVETNQLEGQFDIDDNELVYTGFETPILRILVTFAISAADNNQSFEVAVAVNGTREDHTIIPIDLSGPSTTDRAAINIIKRLAHDDRVTLMIRNVTSTSNATVSSMQMTIGH